MFVDDQFFLEAAYISLYLYVYKLSKSKIKIFRKLEPTYKIATQFNNYCDKHINIADDYFKAITGEERETDLNRLKNFQEFYNMINDGNYNTETVVKKMEEITLF